MQEGKNKAKLIFPSRSGPHDEKIKVGMDARENMDWRYDAHSLS